MILLHRLNGSEYLLNSDLIQYVESLPDTVITLTSKEKLVVRESVSEVCERILDFKKLLLSGFNEVPEKGGLA